VSEAVSVARVGPGMIPNVMNDCVMPLSVPQARSMHGLSPGVGYRRSGIEGRRRAWRAPSSQQTRRMTDTPPPLSPPPVGPEGILVIRGASFQIRDLVLTLSSNGGEAGGSMRPMLSWDIWPLWLRVAIDHEAAARRFRADLLTADGPENDQRRQLLVEEETRAGMVAVTAGAFTFEALALSAASKAGLSTAGIGSNSGTGARVAEVLKQCFAIPQSQFNDWRAGIKNLFRARNEAVHSDAGFHDPLPHPALRAGVPRPVHVYRLENATAAVEGALTTVLALSAVPRQRHGEFLRDASAAWKTIAEELRDHRQSLTGG